MGRGDTLLNAVLGAIVTTVLIWAPVAPLFGGAVAGYLQDEGQQAAIKVGVLSGVIALLPAVLVLVVLASVLSFVPAVGIPAFPVAILLVIVVFAFVATVAYTVGLSALGGYLGQYVRAEL